MKIAHAALYVDSLENSKNFFETYFNARANTRYHNPNTGLSTYFLSFEDGAKLEIMHRSGKTPDVAIATRQGFHHLAFALGSPNAVDTLTARLKADGYTVFSEPRTTGDGYYESCILDGEGNMIELVA